MMVETHPVGLEEKRNDRFSLPTLTTLTTCAGARGLLPDSPLGLSPPVKHDLTQEPIHNNRMDAPTTMRIFCPMGWLRNVLAGPRLCILPSFSREIAEESTQDPCVPLNRNHGRLDVRIKRDISGVQYLWGRRVRKGPSYVSRHS